VAIAPRDLPDVLEERAQSQRALDRWGSLSVTYSQWHTDIGELYNLYAGNWGFLWPDKKAEYSQPKVPDFIRLAAEDRARTVAASRPNVVCRPTKAGDKARQEADKRERIQGAYWEHSRVMGKIPRWAFDSMMAGVTACRVWPDFTKPKAERFPVYERIEPSYIFPDPVFTAGPWLDSCVVAYTEQVRTIEARFGKELRDLRTDRDKRNAQVRVIEYYSPEQVTIVAEYEGRNAQKTHTVLLNELHRLDCTPVVIGARPTADGIYHGEFDNAVDLISYANKFATMMLDDAIQKVYPEKVTFDVEDSEEYGPGAEHRLETRDGRYEYIQQPNQPFSNLQLYRDMLNSIRTTTIMPPARSGDPNESIISAAGISAAASQYLEAVTSTQRDVIKPMLEAANELAFKTDVAYSGDVSKTIFGGARGERYQETYNPKRDIGDYSHNEVVYGAGSALDDINRNVMVLQQWAQGNGLISKRTAMEQSPFIEDPQRETKQQLREQLHEAMKAGLIAQAAQGNLDALTLANISKALDDDKKSLEDAIVENTPVAPLAQPQGSAPLPSTGSPGIAGAEEPQEPGANLPDLAALGLA
jgi:hypothetical protein